MKKRNYIKAMLCLFGFGFATLGANAQNAFPLTGNVGIGTDAPVYPLHLFSSNSTSSHPARGILFAPAGSNELDQHHLFSAGNSSLVLGHINDDYSSTIMTLNNSTIGFGFQSSGQSIQNLTLTESGKVIVGGDETLNQNPTPDQTDYKLLVAGGGLFEEVKVQAQPWPDYVFAEDYKLETLEETKNFIAKNGHLPDFPSAEEVDASNGIKIGEISRIQQEKIEEIYLHLMNLQDRVNELEEENLLLKSKID